MLVLRVSLLPLLLAAAVALILIWEFVLHRPDVVLDAEGWKIWAGRHGKALAQAERKLEQCVAETESVRVRLQKVEQAQAATAAREVRTESNHALCRRSLHSARTREEACQDALKTAAELQRQGLQQVCLELPERAKQGGFKVHVSYGSDGELVKVVNPTVKANRRQACFSGSMLEGAKKIQICEIASWAPACFDYAAVQTVSQ